MAEGEHAERDEEQRQEEDVAAGEGKDDERDRYGYSYDTQHVTFSCDAVAWRRTEGRPPTTQTPVYLSRPTAWLASRPPGRSSPVDQ